MAALRHRGVGYLVERFLFRPIASEPIRGFIVSLGLIIAMQHIALKIWGSEQRAIDARCSRCSRSARCGSRRCESL